ncbi:MAG: hypothetical protein LBU87_00540 [Lactobacillales bacterium]|jgi:hypothetical protein|nr:hypothetical protein [Lactobacillales bacterium]
MSVGQYTISEETMDQLCRSLSNASMGRVVADLKRFGLQGEDNSQRAVMKNGATPMHYTSVVYAQGDGENRKYFLNLEASLFMTAILLGAGFDPGAKARAYVHPVTYDRISSDKYSKLALENPEKASEYTEYEMSPAQRIALRKFNILYAHSLTDEYKSLNKKMQGAVMSFEQLDDLAKQSPELARAFCSDRLVAFYKKAQEVVYTGPELHCDFRVKFGKLTVNPMLYNYVMEKTKEGDFWSVYACIRKYKLYGKRALRLVDAYGHTPVTASLPAGEPMGNLASKNELRRCQMMLCLWLGAGVPATEKASIFKRKNHFSLLDHRTIDLDLKKEEYKADDLMQADMDPIEILMCRKKLLLDGRGYRTIYTNYCANPDEIQKEAILKADPVLRKAQQYDTFAAFVKRLSLPDRFDGRYLVSTSGEKEGGVWKGFVEKNGKPGNPVMARKLYAERFIRGGIV